MENNLGKVGRDKITGFRGVITSYHIYLTGCHQYGLSPADVDKDGQPMKVAYFDTGRVFVGEQVYGKETVQDSNPGGPEMDRP